MDQSLSNLSDLMIENVSLRKKIKTLRDALRQAYKDMDINEPAEIDWPREAQERIKDALKATK